MEFATLYEWPCFKLKNDGLCHDVKGSFNAMVAQSFANLCIVDEEMVYIVG